MDHHGWFQNQGLHSSIRLQQVSTETQDEKHQSGQYCTQSFIHVEPSKPTFGASILMGSLHHNDWPAFIVFILDTLPPFYTEGTEAWSAYARGFWRWLEANSEASHHTFHLNSLVYTYIICAAPSLLRIRQDGERKAGIFFEAPWHATDCAKQHVVSLSLKSDHSPGRKLGTCPI